MGLDEIIEQYMSIIILASVSCIVLLFIIVLVQAIRMGKMNKRYKKFMSGKDGESLEELVLSRFQEVDTLIKKEEINNKKLNEVSDALAQTYQKMGIVKYDAFKEMGGKLSFALALLDDQNSGIVLNSMHSSREGCYTYAKEIIHGESYVVLSEEEKEALNIALNKKNYME